MTRGKNIILYEIVELVLIIIFIFFPVRYFIFRPFIVKGESMVPSFQSGDYLIVDELTYRLHPPRRGDIIVFKYPNNPQENYIKRIIGLPGETVKIQDGKIYIYSKDYPNGLALLESYLPASIKTFPNESVSLAKNQFFVLGDNRSNSYDSRSWGILPKSDIIGRVLVRLWPPQDLTVFASPQYLLGNSVN